MKSIYLRCENLQKLMENCNQNTMIKYSCSDYGFNSKSNASYSLYLFNFFVVMYFNYVPVVQ